MPTKSENTENLTRQIINIIAYVAFVVISACAVSVPFNKNYLMDVVSRYNPDFMASGYVWYIFGLVAYVFFLCFVLYQACSKRRHDKGLRSLDIPFWILIIMSIVWTFGFFYDLQWLAFCAVLIKAVAVFYIYITQGIGKTKVSKKHYLCVHFPFSIVAAATMFSVISTVAMFCIRYNLIWWGIGETAWTVVAMLVYAFFVSYFMISRTDIAFGCTSIWLASGIVVYQNGHNPIVTYSALVLTLYFAVITFASAFHKPRKASSGK